MEAIRIQKVVEKDGEILMKGLPCKKGQHVELIVLIESSGTSGQLKITADRLCHSGVIGLWKDRVDIADSAVYARQLRERAQSRRG